MCENITLNLYECYLHINCNEQLPAWNDHLLRQFTNQRNNNQTNIKLKLTLQELNTRNF